MQAVLALPSACKRDIENHEGSEAKAFHHARATQTIYHIHGTFHSWSYHGACRAQQLGTRLRHLSTLRQRSKTVWMAVSNLWQIL